MVVKFFLRVKTFPEKNSSSIFAKVPVFRGAFMLVDQIV